MQHELPVHSAFPWDDVRLFLALCRARTVHGAARALRVDASTVSRRLALLEQSLSATLFERSRDGITRTESADELMPIAEEMEQVMTRFANTTQRLEREASGLVRITCPPDVAHVLVTPVLRELLARHPGLRVAVDPREAVLDLSRREADLALRTVRPTRGDLLVRRLTTARWVLVASPKLSQSMGTLRAWDAVPWVGWEEHELASIGAARWFQKHVRGSEPRVRSDSLSLQLAAVAEGVGVALVPEPSVHAYGLVPVKLGAALRAAAAEWPVDELFLVTHRALRSVPRVRVVWDLLVARWGERPRR